MAYQGSFSIVKNYLMYGTSKECNGFRNKVCVLHLKAAFFTHSREERAADLCAQPVKNPGIQRTVHT